MIRKEKHLDNKRRKGSDKKEKSMKKMVNIIEINSGLVEKKIYTAYNIGKSKDKK